MSGHEQVWTVPAEVLRIVDGDTIRLRLDLGWYVYTEKNCRITGVNAPELRTPMGKNAAAWAREQLPIGMPCVFESHELDKYGRPLGRLLYPADGAGAELVDFGTRLINAGHAVEYLP